MEASSSGSLIKIALSALIRTALSAILVHEHVPDPLRQRAGNTCGSEGDKGSDARRLSLKRALAIRQVLIDDGVPAERIDVRAMGGVDDTGPADRVDVFVKA